MSAKHDLMVEFGTILREVGDEHDLDITWRYSDETQQHFDLNFQGRGRKSLSKKEKATIIAEINRRWKRLCDPNWNPFSRWEIVN